MNGLRPLMNRHSQSAECRTPDHNQPRRWRILDRDGRQRVRTHWRRKPQGFDVTGFFLGGDLMGARMRGYPSANHFPRERLGEKTHTSNSDQVAT